MKKNADVLVQWQAPEKNLPYIFQKFGRCWVFDAELCQIALLKLLGFLGSVWAKSAERASLLIHRLGVRFPLPSKDRPRRSFKVFGALFLAPKKLLDRAYCKLGCTNWGEMHGGRTHVPHVHMNLGTRTEHLKRLDDRNWFQRLPAPLRTNEDIIEAHFRAAFWHQVVRDEDKARNSSNPNHRSGTSTFCLSKRRATYFNRPIRRSNFGWTGSNAGS